MCMVLSRCLCQCITFNFCVQYMYSICVFCVSLHVLGCICGGGCMKWKRTMALYSFGGPPYSLRCNEDPGKKEENLVRVEKKTEIPRCESRQLKWKLHKPGGVVFNDVICDVITLALMPKNVCWSIFPQFCSATCLRDFKEGFIVYLLYLNTCSLKSRPPGLQ